MLFGKKNSDPNQENFSAAANNAPQTVYGAQYQPVATYTTGASCPPQTLNAVDASGNPVTYSSFAPQTSTVPTLAGRQASQTVLVQVPHQTVQALAAADVSRSSTVSGGLISGIISSILGRITGIITGVPTAVITFVTGMVGNIRVFITGLVGDITKLISDLMQAITGGVTTTPPPPPPASETSTRAQTDYYVPANTAANVQRAAPQSTRSQPVSSYQVNGTAQAANSTGYQNLERTAVSRPPTQVYSGKLNVPLGQASSSYTPVVTGGSQSTLPPKVKTSSSTDDCSCEN